MLTNCIKDSVDLAHSDKLTKSKTRDNTFVRFFTFKFVSDCLCIFGGLGGVISVLAFSYCLSVFAYYTVAVGFILNSCFCIYVFTVIDSWKFWWNVGIWRLFDVISWYIYDYVWLIFTWLLFCNMVDISRKKQEQESQKNQYNFGF